MKLQSRRVFLALAFVCVGAAEPAMSQYNGGREEAPAVSGYEQELAADIRTSVKGFSPQTDNLGDV
jgi:hypothetical protein